jgi:AbrB family looped-hinge helix DNA binding protein
VGTTHSVRMGDRGRLVVPAPLRERAGWHEGSVLVFVETDAGIAVLTREQLKARVRQDLADTDLVADLLRERREAAVLEDQG